MAITINPDAQAPGRAASKRAHYLAERSLTIMLLSFALDASYPNGGANNNSGYDISGANGPWDVLRVVKHVEVVGFISPGAAPAAGSRVDGVVDLVNKRLRVYVNGTEVVNGVSLANVTQLWARAVGIK